MDSTELIPRRRSIALILTSLLYRTELQIGLAELIRVNGRCTVCLVAGNLI